VAWAHGLIAAITASGQEADARLLADLQGFAQVFQRAQAIGARWHFAIDI
jgi:hypothetical protein